MLGRPKLLQSSRTGSFPPVLLLAGFGLGVFGFSVPFRFGLLSEVLRKQAGILRNVGSWRILLRNRLGSLPSGPEAYLLGCIGF